MNKPTTNAHWFGIFNNLLNGRGKSKKLKPQSRRRFSIEPLEERTMLSVSVWDGGGNNNFWSTAANWVDDVAPTAGADLCFEGSVRTSTQNDFTSGTSFASLKFASDNFSLSGNSLTLTDGITVNSGVASSAISLNIALDGSIVMDVVDASLIVSGVLSGSGSLTKNGAGTLIFTGNNTYSSGTTINNGTLQVGNDGTTGSLGGGGVTNWTSLVFNRSDDVTVSNVISGTMGTVTQAGGGTLTLSGNNTFAGDTIINSGTLALGSTSALGATSNGLHVNGSNAALDLNGRNLTASSVVLSDGCIVNNGSTATINSSHYYVMEGEISANLVGNGWLTKIGNGTVTLSGANTYTGLTTVCAGTLIIGKNGHGTVFNGGGADIRGGAIVFDYSGGGTDPASSILTILDAGYAQTPKFSSGQIKCSTINSALGLGFVDDTTAQQVKVARIIYGDANLDGIVDLADLGMIQIYYEESGVWYQGDFDYSGQVDMADLGTVQVNYGEQLAHPTLTLSGEDTTTEGSVYTLTLGEVTGITVASYTIHWDDGYTDTYTAAEIEALNGQVTHQYGAACSLAIMVDLIDIAGIVYPSVSGWGVTLIHASCAPFIGDFYLIREISDVWTLTGFVEDYDDNVEGFVVTFGGVFAAYNLKATVQCDGLFCLTVELIGLELGVGTAQTCDPHGILSNVAMDYILGS